METTILRCRTGPAAMLLAGALLAGCSTLQPPARAPVATPRPALPSAPPAVAIAEPAPSPTPASAVPDTASPAAAEPAAAETPAFETGLASWYGAAHHGRRTASGERFDMNALTAAHRTLPLPSYALVRNPANRRELVVRINDRGPYKRGRIIDLSRAAARQLGIAGLGMVELRPLTAEEVRSGGWKLPGERVAGAAVR